MSDALENKAVEILDASQKALGSFSDKMMEMAKQYGPEVADAALTMARIDAAADLIRGVLFVAFMFWWMPKLFSWASEAAKSNGEDAFLLARVIASGLVTFVFGLFAAISYLPPLFDVWRWVGIFEPKLWLAKRVLGL